jgi:hypothetical protein
MATKIQQWLEDFDDLINRVPDLYIPEAIKDHITDRLEQIQLEVTEQVELRSTDWEA